MKTMINILSLLLLLTSYSCQNSKTEVYPLSHQADEADMLWSDSLSEIISLEELPITIKDEINKDELFQQLNITNITRIKAKNTTYYDMTFKDADGRLIMVFYDERGEIIVP